MAQAVFATLIIGLVFETAGTQMMQLTGENEALTMLVEMRAFAKTLKGPAIKTAVWQA